MWARPVVLSERVFVRKLNRIGFTDIRVVERQPFGLERAAAYPLFTDELIELMRRLIAPERHDEITVSITVTANKRRGDQPAVD
ncbi:MAG: hypothetical protein ACRDWS_15110 [Acidimicrobiia bacterium]